MLTINIIPKVKRCFVVTTSSCRGAFHYSLKKKSKALEEEHLTERVKMNETKSVSVPTFSGKEEDYELFWPRFVAYADMKGFAEAIEWENPDPDLPNKHDVLDSDPDVKKKQEAAIKRNKTAMAAFILAFQTKASLNMINEAKSSNYPRGLAYLVAKELQHNCNPKDRVAKLEATNALRAMKMKTGTKPSKSSGRMV